MAMTFTRRKFAAGIGSILSGLGILGTVGAARSAEAQAASGVQKLDYDGKPASGKQMITSLIVHNGLQVRLAAAARCGVCGMPSA